jgi:hypothetical protein
MNISEWSQFVAIAVGGAFGLFCLFDGTRRVAGGDADGRGGRLFAIGLLIVGMLAGHAYYQHWTYTDVLRVYRAEAPRELPADWGRKMAPAKRESASQNMARNAYVSAGVLQQHFDINGQRKPFSPAADDIKRRDSMVATAARVENKADEFFQQMVLWLVLAGSAVVFGIGFALEAPAKPVEVEERIEPTAPAAAVARPPLPPQPQQASQPSPPKPAAPAPAAKPPAGIVTAPMPKPAVGGDTVPLPKPAASVGSDTVPLPKPPPGAFAPPKKS